MHTQSFPTPYMLGVREVGSKNPREEKKRKVFAFCDYTNI